MIIKVPLQLSSSSDMNENGVTPKTFSYSITQTTKLLGFRISLIDEGATDFTKFGAITALTNGVLIQVIKGGVTTTLATIRDNGDLVGVCDDTYFGSGSVLSILGVSTPQGLLNSNDIFLGNFKLNDDEQTEIILESGDTIQAVIQDNLSGIDSFRIYAKLGYQ